MKEKPMIQKTLVLFLGILLSGCASHMNEEFECNPGKGVGCQSITEVKKKLNKGQITLPETTLEAHKKEGSSSVLLPPVLKSTGVSATGLSVVDSQGTVIQRTPEKPLRVWIAPYQDQDGNLREASVVHTVIRPGYWQLNAASFPSGPTAF